MGSTLKDESEVLVLVHNPSATFRDDQVEIQVATKDYDVQVWCPKTKHFYNMTSMSSFMRQHHRHNNGDSSLDYKLLVPFKLFPNEIGYIKLLKK